MLFIVDVNCFRAVFLEARTASYAEVFAFLKRKNQAAIVYGGKLLEEYKHDAEILSILASLDASGRARKIPDAELTAITKAMKLNPQRKSDDEHILGLAVATGARVLVTQDILLTSDFRNRALLPPRGGKVIRDTTGGKRARELLTRGCR